MNRDEEWTGTFHELAIELTPTKSDARLTAALEALWAQSGLTHLPREAETSEVHPTETEFTRFMHGMLQLPERELGCVVVVLREHEGSDWIVLGVPEGMMSLAGYPPGDPLSEGFLSALDRKFLQLADAVFAVVPFDLALIGEEVSGLLYARDFFESSEKAEWYVRHGGLLIRPALLNELSTRVVAERRPNGLLYIERSRNVA